MHRVGKGYKSGSFKGLDFTFGRNGSFGGILIRSIERADGSVVCGPSLCVDNFINAGSFNNVGELDKAVAGRPVWDEQNPLHFAPCDPNQNAVFATARVGLNGFTIQDKSPWEYVVKRHRFLCGPREIKKGRIHLILAMHQDGAAIDEIHQVTGSPRSAIQRHIDFYESSRDMTLDEVENLKPTEMTCALHHRSQ